MGKSLQKKLMVIFTILITIGILSAQLITYFLVKDQVRSEVESRGHAMASELKNDISETIKVYSMDLDRYSKDIRLYNLAITDDKNLEKEIKEDFHVYLTNKTSANATYLGTKNKKFHISPFMNIPSDYDPTVRPWYIEAVNNFDRVIWTEPYFDKVTGHFTITGAKAILKPFSNEVVGVVATDFTFNGIKEMLNSKDLGFKGYPFLLDSNGFAIVHPKFAGKDIKKVDYIAPILKKNTGYLEGTFDGEKRITYYETMPLTNWKVGVVYEEKNLFKILSEILMSTIIIAVIAVIVTLTVVYFLSVRISRPIKSLALEVQKMSEGDLTVHVKPKTNDEVGQLTISFNNMVAQMNELIVEVEKSVVDVSKSAESLSAISQETIATSEEVASAINDVAKGSTTQANEVDKVMESTEKLGYLIENVNNSIGEMNKLSVESTNVSKDGMNRVKDLRIRSTETLDEIKAVEQTISELVVSVKEIESVIATINEISAQTNLLALNASIEAARAGESGRGFAVVADEVRKLAEQSAKATEQVKSTIGAIQIETELAVKAMNKTKQISLQTEEAVDTTEKSFTIVTEVSNKLVDLINKVFSETTKVDESKEFVLNGVRNISLVTQQSAATAEEVSASTDEQLIVLNNIAKSAEVLNDSSSKLTDLIKKFKIK
ncbi:MAG: methyl-accepting chemotaxis signaling domain protein [Bacillales bacterium]|nr:methyl-accepting chemotaxis signaling domain protein [Bacillales bacterium]